MNILLIHQYFLEKEDPGGSRFNEMARMWISDGHRVTVLCGMVNYVTGKTPSKYNGLKFSLSEYEPGLEVLRCFVSPVYNINFFGRLWAYFSFVWYGVWGVFIKLKDRKYDVIIATSPPLFIGIIAWIISKIRQIPFVFEVRDLWPESAIDTGVLQNSIIIRLAFWFEKFIYHRAVLVNVLTPAFRDVLIKKKSVPVDKISLIPNACDFELSDHLFESFDIKRFRERNDWIGKTVVIYVGAHGVANHLVQLLVVADRLRSTSLYFVLIGDGMQKPELQEEARKRELKNVEFIEPMSKSEVMKYIMAADVGISILKKTDAFKTVYSNKTFDYMACKKPILMVIDGISRQLVEEARCGVYAEPENISDIASKIEILSQNPTLRKEMGELGYAYAKLHFDRHVLADSYIRELQNRLKIV